MGWKTIKGHRYYYSSRRVGGRVVSEYVGRESDLLSRLRAQREAMRIEREASQRLVERAERACIDTSDAAVRSIFALVGAIVAAVLEGTGHHRHERGAWRRRRHMNPRATALPALRPMDEELGPLVARAIGGDEEAACAVEDSLRADPRRFVGLAFKDSDGECLSGDVLDLVADHLMEMDVHDRAKLELRMRQVREELEGQHPTALERLLITRILMCWFHLQTLELGIACDKDATARNLEWQDRRRERAHRMYIQAIKSLAQVRRLQLPTLLQVNVAQAGGRQVNVAGLSGPNSCD